MSSEKREKFGSRFGFIMVAAGCAVGLGNVWKFPYLCGEYGGAIFVVIYLLCLAFIAFPILVCEISVGRASQKSCAKAFDILQPKGTRWKKASWLCVAGNYLLMMFYTAVCGWMLIYFIKFITGSFGGDGITPDAVSAQFGQMLSAPWKMLIANFAVIALSFGICSLGVQKGVEKITKLMMSALFILIGILAIHSCFLPGAEKGLEFYLVPNFDALNQIGYGTVIFNAMSQAFFTLSIGIGCMAIFGSYLDKSRSLTGEGIAITCLDTVVAITSGFIIIPACFAFGIAPDSGPSLVFVTMPNVFVQMTGGMIWGALFFLFLFFASLSTVIAVFENIISFAIDLWGWKRSKTVIINLVAMTLVTLPCILGFNVWSSIQPLGEGSTILDLEDFLVSNNLLPLGALIYLLFCVRKNGWGWTNFIQEANSGSGMKFPVFMKFFLSYILPVLIVIIYLKGFYDKFSAQGTGYLALWMSIAVLILAYVGWIAFSRPQNAKNDSKVIENKE